MTASPNTSPTTATSQGAVLVLYASRHGHAQRIAEHVAEQLSDRALQVELVNLKELPSEFALTPYRAAVLVAGVHIGKHPRELVEFVTRRRDALEAMFTLLLSVSLSQAGVEDVKANRLQRAASARDVRRMIDQFYVDTSFHPTRAEPVAGALAYTKYNPLIRLVMKRIARAAGASTDTSLDHDLTNWKALDGLVSELADDIRALERPTPAQDTPAALPWFELGAPTPQPAG